MTPLPTVPPDDADYPPLSALNDFLFCARRCAIHRLEGVWLENQHTTAGTIDHRRVHAVRDSEESSFRTARGLRLISHELCVQGVADLVEFHPSPTGGEDIPFPIEYKRGKRRKWDNDEVQLCAQAMCLEEMRGVVVPEGAIFHIRSKRRRVVAFDAALRSATRRAAEQLLKLLSSGVTPSPIRHAKCLQCSVRSVCLPDLIGDTAAYLRAAAKLFSVSPST